MAPKYRSLFAPVVANEKQHSKFKILKRRRSQAPARHMLNQVYHTFDDSDGNFLIDFQSSGFNARYFELYLYAYLTRSGFNVERPSPAPDFIVSRNGHKVAIEATTINPATSGVLAQHGNKIENLTTQQRLEYQKNELAVRFGSPLVSKLRKKYWEQKHCKEMPLVIAIEAFHDDESLIFSDYSLCRYVFGIDHTGQWTQDGKLEITSEPITEHQFSEKNIPSGFFALPDAEHISAVIFTNSGSNAKFLRMGFQHGIDNDRIVMIRQGYAYDIHEDARDSAFFSYNLDQPPFVESWGQGIAVLHNPFALHPIPHGYFSDAIDHYIDNSRMATEMQHPWSPMSSHTFVTDLGVKSKVKLAHLPFRTPSIAVVSIQKREFQALAEVNHDANPLFEEDGWYADDTTSFIGTLVHDHIDDEWGPIILARNLLSQFCAIETNVSFETREEARQDLYQRFVKLLKCPQRIFEQGNELAHLLKKPVARKKKRIKSKK